MAANDADLPADPPPTPADPGGPVRPNEADANRAARWREDRIGATEARRPSEQGITRRRLVGTQWTEAELPCQNRLLAALPGEAYARLRPRLEPVELTIKELLWEKDEPIRHVYFPLNGVVSMVTVMTDGSSVEVGTVGNEGMAGIPVFLGATRAPLRAFSQIPGVALRMSADDLREELNENGALRELLHRYTQALFSMLAQTAACRSTHTASQRLALWLLMVHDRVAVDRFPMTQEFMAMMLGVRRATVTEEAGRLQKARIIDYQRGILTILDRPALQARSCECYAVIRGEYDRLLDGLGD